jgi:hypothetical protein
MRAAIGVRSFRSNPLNSFVCKYLPDETQISACGGTPAGTPVPLESRLPREGHLFADRIGIGAKYTRTWEKSP